MAVSSYRAAVLTIFLVICFYVNYLRVVQKEFPAENSYIQTGISYSVGELSFPTAGDSSNEYIPGHIRRTETATKARSGETQPGNLSANNIPNHLRNTNTAFSFTQTLLKTSDGRPPKRTVTKETKSGARSGNTSDVNKMNRMWNTEAANISERPGSRNEPIRDVDTAKQGYGGLVKKIYYRKVVNALTLQSQDQPIPRNESITLVTQCSKDRLDRLRIQAHFWNGPISSAVYLDRKDRKLAMEKHVDDLKTFFSKGLKRRAQITFSFVLANVEASGYNSRYPINALRNLAVDIANTSEALFAMKPLRIITPMNAAYIFVLDVDFIPSLETYQILQNFTISFSTQERLNSSKSLKQAYVVPAFKIKVLDLASFPNNFTEASRQYKSRLLASFQNGGYHSPTNYKQWLNSSVPYTVEYKEPYEPFLVLRKQSMPRFDERFRGYGRNKVAFVQELATKGYSFIVIPRCFVVHLPHKKSPSSKLMNGEEFMKMGEIYETFKAEIRGIRTGT